MKNLVIPFFIAALLLSSCMDQSPATVPPPPIILPVATLNSKSATTDIEYPASIQGTVDIEIRPQVSGHIDRVLVDEGSYVTKGQLLFKINDKPFREELNNALASLNGYEAACINAQLDVEKSSSLVEHKVISDYQLKAAKASLKIATANIAQAKAMVETAKINLSYTNVTAPVNGYIGRLPKKQGSIVASTDIEPLTALSNVDEVYAYFSLGETDFINFKDQYPGNTLDNKINNMPPVSLLLANNTAYPELGKIDMVDGQFDKNTGSITLRASFPNKNGVLRSGNTGRIRLSLLHNEAIIVPQSATTEMQDKIFVFTLNQESKVAKTPITILGKSGTNYLIKDGVKEGDRIVLSGIDKLQDGQVIQADTSTTKVTHNNNTN